MSSFVERLGRQQIIGLGLIAVSLVVLAISVLIIVTSLQGDEVVLPAEGDVDSLLRQQISENSYVIPGYESKDLIGGQIEHGPQPTKLAIPQLYIEAPVVRLGTDANNVPLVPQNAGDVAWYEFSQTPGKDDNSVFSGHVDWQTRTGAPIPGVFYRLRELRIGDDIQVTLDDGSALTYRVIGNIATTYDDPNVVKAMQPTTNDVITLITCGGSWIRDASKGEFGGVYSHRIIVRAELVEPAAAAAGVGS